MAKRYPRVEEYKRLDARFKRAFGKGIRDTEAYDRLEELRNDFTEEEWAQLQKGGSE